MCICGGSGYVGLWWQRVREFVVAAQLDVLGPTAINNRINDTKMKYNVLDQFH